MLAMFVVYNRRYRNVRHVHEHGEESTQLEIQNMTQHYDHVQGTVEEGKYTDPEGDNTVAEGDFTELIQRDPETPYEELKE